MPRHANYHKNLGNLERHTKEGAVSPNYKNDLLSSSKVRKTNFQSKNENLLNHPTLNNLNLRIFEPVYSRRVSQL